MVPSQEIVPFEKNICPTHVCLLTVVDEKWLITFQMVKTLDLKFSSHSLQIEELWANESFPPNFQKETLVEKQVSLSNIAQFQVNIDWVTEETLQKIITITITMLCLKLGLSVSKICKIHNQNTTVSMVFIKDELEDMDVSLYFQTRRGP